MRMTLPASLLPLANRFLRSTGTGDGPLSSFSLQQTAICLATIAALMLLALALGHRSWLAILLLLASGSTLAAIVLSSYKTLWPTRERWWEIVALSGIAVTLGCGLGVYAALTVQHDVLSWLNTEQLYLLASGFSGLLLALELWRNHRAAMQARLRRAEQNRLRLEKALMEAELRALQAQVEPHFLYNTLANTQYLTQRDPALAAQMIGHLISYLRTSLPDLRAPISTIRRECQLASDFLAIMAIRMQARLRYQILCPDDLKNHDFPPLMLISLVENAVKHGVDPKPAGGDVHIEVSARSDRLCVTVTDTGVGLVGNSSGSGIGLANIVSRLRALYGDAASFQLRANNPMGVEACITLPLSHGS